jgi:hypothetical protein
MAHRPALVCVVCWETAVKKFQHQSLLVNVVSLQNCIAIYKTTYGTKKDLLKILFCVQSSTLKIYLYS